MVIKPKQIGPLFRLGGWMTVGNIIGPLMLYMDRFVIGALISATAVAYYITPYEVVTKLLIISTAIAAVMFPAFSLSSAQDFDGSSVLYRQTLKYTLAILLPLTVFLLLIAKRGLSLWLGNSFGSNSYRVTQFLLIGAFALSMEALPFALLQGLGRPDIPAKVNLAEIPIYAGALYWLIQNYGVAGAAAAWSLRAIVDSLLLLFFANRLLGKPRTQVAEVSAECAVL
jgi:O-antigen/teichoic acid export membrane protein